MSLFRKLRRVVRGHFGNKYAKNDESMNFIRHVKDISLGSLLIAILLLTPIISLLIVSLNTAYATNSSASVPFSDSFGSTDINNITNWDDNDGDGSSTYIQGNASSRPGSPTTGHARIGQSGWVCRTIDASGKVALKLTYYWQGDLDAESSDDGFVEYKTGGNCNDASGWTNLTEDDLNQNTASWSSQESISLPAALDNQTFKLRYRSDANSAAEQYRVDDVEVTGYTAASWPTSWTTPNACVADPSGDENPAEIDLIGSTGTPAVGFYSDDNYQYFRERVNGDPGGAGGSFHQYAWVTMLQTSLPEYQYLASLNGKDDKVQLWQNTTAAGPVDFSPILVDPAESVVWEGSAASFARAVDGGGVYYVDWAIPLTELESRGITTSTTKFFATSADGNNFNKDYLDCYEALSDVSITKADNVDPIISGDTETYTLTITNNGPDIATGVVVTDTLPAGFTPTSVTPSIGSCSDVSAPSLQCELGSMSNGATATITVIGTLVGNGVVTNVAGVTSTTLDTNTANNSDNEDTTINPAVGSVSVQKKVDSDGNGSFEGGNTEANTLGFDWGLDQNSVNNNMGVTLSSVPAGAHTVTESGVSGYHFVGWFLTGSREFSCSSPEGTSLPASINVVNAQTTDITLCNARDTGTLKLIKTVVLDNSGTADASDFSLYVKQNGVDVVSSPAAGSASGTVYTLPTGSYTVGEGLLPSGYEQTSIFCDNQETSTASVTKDTEAVCTITNDDQSGTIIVKKEVINDNGGTAVADNFVFQVNGGEETPFSDGQKIVEVDAGTYTVTEPSVDGYGTTYENCNELNIPNGGSATCTITNDDDAPSLTLNKVVTNNNGGNAPESAWTLTATGSGESPTNLSGPGALGENDVQSGTDFKADTYTLNEAGGPNGYTASSWSCTNRVTVNGNNQITLVNGQTTVCTITNDDQSGTIIVKKEVINDNGGTAVADNFVFQVNGGEETPFSDGQKIVEVDAGTYTVTEPSVDGYGTSYDNCTELVVPNGGSATCTITNDDQPGTVTVTKYHDLDENGQFNNEEPVLEDWGINLANEESQTTDPTGTVIFSSVSAGSQQLSENQQEGWVQSGITCDRAEGSLDGNTYYFNLANGETIFCYIGNHYTPVLNITKTNDKPNPTTVGDTVLYTVTVTVPENSGRVYGSNDAESNYLPVVTTDTPPNNFTYVAGSWTADSNVRGDLKAAGITVDPAYASPGSWILTSIASNYLVPGEIISLTYKAVIGAIVPPGTYPDEAYVLGYNNANAGGNVLGVAINSQCGNNGQYAISCVTIIAPPPPPPPVLGLSTTTVNPPQIDPPRVLAASTIINPPKVDPPKVLAASTTLADTGSGLVESTVAGVLILATIGIAVHGWSHRKRA